MLILKVIEQRARSSILTRAVGKGALVIATNIGGLPEYKKNLVLIPPNDPHPLADAISELIVILT